MNITPYTLLGLPQTRAIRVAWMLEELGQSYVWHAAPPRSDAARAHHPLGKIPLLLVDGTVLADSVAIMQFLADRHGGLTHPAGSLDRARQDAATQHLVAEVDAALWTGSKHTHVLPEAERQAAMLPVAAAEFGRAMAALETLWEGGPYLAGEIVTVPDILACHCAGWARMRKLALPDGAFGNYLKSLRHRPSIAAAKARATEAGLYG